MAHLRQLGRSAVVKLPPLAVDDALAPQHESEQESRDTERRQACQKLYHESRPGYGVGGWAINCGK